ncbi:MAG TPA: hypothetical protein VEA80_12845 [Vitreimonas sp.]|uniref:hypothetical protein n=1 Tax=Vitreimonas sp. TaxID=3069702 RepID=UPI002D2E83A3|nr:hypothetical protein [Vitreimonas sp.]HYD88356.1 hypothetical protein [Vitreimonas sp.]
MSSVASSMRSLAAALAASAASAGAAFAEDLSDPTGRLTITLDPSWRQISAAPSDEVIFMIEPAELQPLASCQLSRIPQPLPQAQTRAVLNAATERMRTSPAIVNYENHPEVTLESIEVDNLDGVAVLDVRLRFASIVAFERRVFLQAPGELELYTLACSAHPADAEAAEQAFATARSLRVRE